MVIVAVFMMYQESVDDADDYNADVTVTQKVGPRHVQCYGYWSILPVDKLSVFCPVIGQ